MMPEGPTRAPKRCLGKLAIQWVKPAFSSISASFYSEKNRKQVALEQINKARSIFSAIGASARVSEADKPINQLTGAK